MNLSLNTSISNALSSCILNRVPKTEEKQCKAMSKQDKAKDNYPLGVMEHLSNCVRDWFRSQFTFKLSMVLKKIESRIENGFNGQTQNISPTD